MIHPMGIAMPKKKKKTYNYFKIFNLNYGIAEKKWWLWLIVAIAAAIGETMLCLMCYLARRKYKGEGMQSVQLYTIFDDQQ